MAPGIQEIYIRAVDQFLESVGGFVLGDTERDRVSLVRRPQCCRDRVHALPRSSAPEVRASRGGTRLRRRSLGGPTRLSATVAGLPGSVLRHLHHATGRDREPILNSVS